jgi:hypothetical protein
VYRCCEGGVTAATDTEPPAEPLEGQAAPAAGLDLLAFARVHHASSIALQRRAAVFSLRELVERGALVGVRVVA